MTREQIQADVMALEAKIKQTEVRAQSQRRTLTAEEERAIRASRECIEELMHAPHDALSQPGAHLGRPGGAAMYGAMGEGFPSFGAQMQAVARAMTPGGQADPRLFRAATGLNETIPSEGAFLVQQDYSSQIYSTAFDVGKLAKRCWRMPVSAVANSIKINALDETSRVTGSRHGGVTSYWLAEAAEKTASKPAFRQMELTLKKSVVLIYATDELLSDSGALEAYIRKVAADEIAFNLDDAIVNGTGAGQPLGILNSGALVTVSKESGQDADTIIAENIVKMHSRMFGNSLENAVWLVNQAALPALYTLSLSVGVGGVPIFQPSGGLSGKPFNTILGCPVLVCEQCAALGDLGDIVFADLGGYILAEKGGIEAAMSIHVKFIYDESVFRFVYRVDGQPAIASPETPYKGGAGATQSYFVALEAR